VTKGRKGPCLPFVPGILAAGYFFLLIARPSLEVLLVSPDAEGGNLVDFSEGAGVVVY